MSKLNKKFDEKFGKYCIVYMPAIDNEKEPIWGFKTKEEAYKYLDTELPCKLDKNIFGCEVCRAEYNVWEVKEFFPDWLKKFYNKEIQNLAKELIGKTKAIKNAVRKNYGTFKYDSCYDDIICMIKITFVKH